MEGAAQILRFEDLGLGFQGRKFRTNLIQPSLGYQIVYFRIDQCSKESKEADTNTFPLASSKVCMNPLLVLSLY